MSVNLTSITLPAEVQRLGQFQGRAGTPCAVLIMEVETRASYWPDLIDNTAPETAG